MAHDSVQDTTLPSNKLPNTVGVVAIEAPPFKEGTEDTKKPQLNLEAKSIRDTDQAWSLCKSTETANKARSMRAAVMELEYSGQPPFSSGDQLQKAQSWQSNVCTGILAGIVDRKVLRFVNTVAAQVYLTRSSLPTTWPDWKKKSDLFCIKTTRLFQSWDGYVTFLTALAKENVLHGYAFAVFVDPYTWKPKYYKQEIAYVPEESPQISKDLQFFVTKEDYPLNEFIALFKDEKAAEDMGYNLDNCVRAAHNSEVKNPREDSTVTEFRKFPEFMQDGTLGLTYASSGPRVVKTYLLWNQEYDGKISFWIIERDTGKLLRFAHKLYDNMKQAVALFALQPGNGHLHSSKGIGRMVIGNVKIAEKLRNKLVDNIHIGGLIMLKSSSKDRNKVQPIVAAPFIVVDKDIDIPQLKFDPNVEGYENMDQRLISSIEQAAGTWITSNANSSNQPQTATAESIDAKREQENQDMTESRFRDQFLSGVIQEVQRRVYSNEHIESAKKGFKRIAAGEQETEEFYDSINNGDVDVECVKTIIELLKDGITEDEIRILRKQPTSGYAHTDDALTANGILAVKKSFTNNPNIDQVELDKRSVEALAGPDAAKALVLDNPDQTLTAEAVYKQMSESSAMSTLMLPCPVSPRDNHIIHGETVMKLLMGLGHALSIGNTDQKTLKIIELNLNHLGEHLSAYLTSGGVSQSPKFKEQNDFYKKFRTDFEKSIDIIAHQSVASQAPTPELAQKLMAQGGQALNQAPISTGGGAAGTVAGGSRQGVPDLPDNIDEISKDSSLQPKEN